jgi:hypothetical protein
VVCRIAHGGRALPGPCCARSLKIRFAKPPPEPERTDGLILGARISHPTFGLGHITNLDGERVTILFDKSGMKKIAAGFIKLAGG